MMNLLVQIMMRKNHIDEKWTLNQTYCIDQSTEVRTERTIVSLSPHHGPGHPGLPLKCQVLQVCQMESRRGCSPAPPLPLVPGPLKPCPHLPAKQQSNKISGYMYYKIKVWVLRSYLRLLKITSSSFDHSHIKHPYSTAFLPQRTSTSLLKAIATDTVITKLVSQWSRF